MMLQPPNCGRGSCLHARVYSLSQLLTFIRQCLSQAGRPMYFRLYRVSSRVSLGSVPHNTTVILVYPETCIHSDETGNILRGARTSQKGITQEGHSRDTLQDHCNSPEGDP